MRHYFVAEPGQDHVVVNGERFSILEENPAGKLYVVATGRYGSRSLYPVSFRNPLGYHCAPNEADCSYTDATTIEQFMAWCFVRVFNLLEGDSGVTDEDVYQLRKEAIRFVRTLIEAEEWEYWDGTMWDPQGKGEVMIDLEGVDPEDDDREHHVWSWYLHSRGKECYVIDLNYTLRPDGESTEFSQFLSRGVLKSRHRRIKALKHLVEVDKVNELLYKHHDMVEA